MDQTPSPFAQSPSGGTFELVSSDAGGGDLPSRGSCCTACGSRTLSDIFHSKAQPVCVGTVCDTAEEARRAPTADITLAYCHACGLVFNRIFDIEQVGFKPGYEVALNHSPVFCDFISGVADRLVERFDLRGKTVLEIGCGGGYFLRLLAERGGNHGIGIDPTVPREGIERLEEGKVEFIRDFFGDQHCNIATDFVCCLSVFEAIPRPIELLRTLRRMLAERPQVPLYFEVFNAFRAIEQQETWSIHYEQCNYFSLESLTALFRRSGFEVTGAGTCYQGDQYLYVEALPATIDTSEESPEQRVRANELPADVSRFAASYTENVKAWQHRLNEFARQQQRVVVWGTGGKGIGFLNTLDTTGAIDYVIEINPDKQGRFVPGSAQQIMPLEFLAEYRPDKVIITNALYQEEMQEQARQLGVNPEFIIA